MNIFKTRGFDAVVSSGITIAGDLVISPDTTVLIEGEVVGAIRERTTAEGFGNKTKLEVSGFITVERLEVANLTVSGTVRCEDLVVPGVLVLKKGAILEATNSIHYNELVIETGAHLTGKLVVLKHDNN